MPNPNFIIVSGSDIGPPLNVTFTKISETHYMADDSSPAWLDYSAGTWTIGWIGTPVHTRADSSPLGAFSDGACAALRTVDDWGTVTISGCASHADLNGDYTVSGIECGRSKYQNAAGYLLYVDTQYGWMIRKEATLFYMAGYSAETITHKCTQESYSPLAATGAISLSGAGSSPYNQATSSISGEFSATANGLSVSADASGISASGASISSYGWAWGDEGTSSGVTAQHTYASSGAFTITLTVTLSDGSTHISTQNINLQGEQTMASISKISPLMGTAGATVVTITGTGFGATQSTGEVTAGGKALTDITWADTSISGKLAADTPATGAQDVVVTPASGAAATAPKAVFVYDGASKFNSGALRLGKLKKVYIDGVHVGFTEDTVELGRKLETKDYRPNDRTSIVKTFTTGVEDSLKFTLSQLEGANLAMVFGGTYDATSKLVTLTGNDTVAEHSIAMVDALDVAYLFPRCQIIEPPTLTLSPTESVKMPLAWRVLPQDDGAQTSMLIQFP